MKHKRFGFTIIELIVVIAVIGTLAGIAIVGYGAWRESISAAAIKSDLAQAQAAMEDARNFDNAYPLDVATVFNASEDVQLTNWPFNSATLFCLTGTHASGQGGSFYIFTDAASPLAGSCDDMVLPDQSPYETVYTASGTWTKPAGLSHVDVLVIGAGGNGSEGCGGGGGGVWSTTVDGSALPMTVAVSVAGQGSGQASSFGSFATAGAGESVADCDVDGPSEGGAGGGTSTTYGVGGAGPAGGSWVSEGGSGLTGAGGGGGYFTLDAGAGGSGTYGGGGGGAPNFYMPGGAVGAGGNPSGAAGALTGIGGNGGGYGGGGGGNGEGTTGSYGLGAPGVVKVTAYFNS